MKKYSYPTAVLLAVALIAPLLLAACGKTVGETIDDATITTRVKTALLNDPHVGFRDRFHVILVGEMRDLETGFACSQTAFCAIWTSKLLGLVI